MTTIAIARPRIASSYWPKSSSISRRARERPGVYSLPECAWQIAKRHCTEESDGRFNTHTNGQHCRDDDLAHCEISVMGRESSPSRHTVSAMQAHNAWTKF